MRLVFIHGGAAVGKLTVAKELSKLAGLPVFHNHLVVDAVLSVFPFGDPSFVRLREEMWMAMFLEAAGVGRSLIFTFAPEPTVPADFAERVVALWEAQGGRVDFVKLTASREMQEQRLMDESRRAFGKLADVGLLRELRSGFERCEEAMPASAVEIDTGSCTPEDAARRLAETLGL